MSPEVCVPIKEVSEWLGVVGDEAERSVEGLRCRLCSGMVLCQSYRWANAEGIDDEDRKGYPEQQVCLGFGVVFGWLLHGARLAGLWSYGKSGVDLA